jgi:hypothetical protein
MDEWKKVEEALRCKSSEKGACLVQLVGDESGAVELDAVSFLSRPHRSIGDSSKDHGSSIALECVRRRHRVVRYRPTPKWLGNDLRVDELHHLAGSGEASGRTEPESGQIDGPGLLVDQKTTGGPGRSRPVGGEIDV